MSVAKVIELTASSPDSFEDAPDAVAEVLPRVVDRVSPGGRAPRRERPGRPVREARVRSVAARERP